MTSFAELADQPTFKLGLSVSGQMIFGTGTVVIRDLMTKAGFFFPFFWAFLQNLIQASLIVVSWVTGSSSPPSKGKDEASPKETSNPWHLYAILAFLTYAQLAPMNMAYAGLPGSILQMNKGLKLVFVLALSSAFLGRGLKSYQAVGVLLNIGGIAIIVYVGLTGTGWTIGSGAGRSFILVVIATFAQAVNNVMEEYIMKKYEVAADFLAGVEGLGASFIGLTVLILANYYGWEAPTSQALEEMWSRTTILIATIGLMFCIPPDKYAARATSKYSSATLRSLVEIIRVGVIWVIEIFCTWDRFSWTELLGFLVVTVGTMIYGKQVKLPFISYEEAAPLLNSPMEARGFKSALVPAPKEEYGGP